MDYQSGTTNLCRAGTSSSLWYLWGTSEYSTETEEAGQTLEEEEEWWYKPGQTLEEEEE